MNYCVLREEIIDKLESDKINNYQKHKQCVNLLTLEDSCYRNIKYDQDEVKNVQSIDYAQLLQMKRFQEKELEFKRLEKVKNISKKDLHKSNSRFKCNRQFAFQPLLLYRSDLSQLRANLTQEINKTRENLDKFLAIFNNEKSQNKISRQSSRVSFRQKSREKKTALLKKNTRLVEAEKDLQNASTEQNKFKALNFGLPNKIKYPRSRIASLGQKQK